MGWKSLGTVTQASLYTEGTTSWDVAEQGDWDLEVPKEDKAREGKRVHLEQKERQRRLLDQTSDGCQYTRTCKSKGRECGCSARRYPLKSRKELEQSNRLERWNTLCPCCLKLLIFQWWGEKAEQENVLENCVVIHSYTRLTRLFQTLLEMAHIVTPLGSRDCD